MPRLLFGAESRRANRLRMFANQLALYLRIRAVDEDLPVAGLDLFAERVARGMVEHQDDYSALDLLRFLTCREFLDEAFDRYRDSINPRM